MRRARCVGRVRALRDRCLRGRARVTASKSRAPSPSTWSAKRTTPVRGAKRARQLLAAHAAGSRAQVAADERRGDRRRSRRRAPRRPRAATSRGSRWPDAPLHALEGASPARVERDELAVEDEASRAGAAPAARATSGYSAVRSPPLRTTSRTAPSAPSPRAPRTPSYLSSKSQPGRENGAGAVRASVGRSASRSSARSARRAGRSAASTSASRLTLSRTSSTVRPESTEAGWSRTGSWPSAGAAPLRSSSQSRSPRVRTRAKRPRSLWPASSRSSFPAARPSAGATPSTVR